MGEGGRGFSDSLNHFPLFIFFSKRSHISCTVVAPTSSTSSSATHFCASPIWNHKYDSNMLGTLLLCLEICSWARKDEIQVKVLQSESCWWHCTSMLVQIAWGLGVTFSKRPQPREATPPREWECERSLQNISGTQSWKRHQGHRPSRYKNVVSPDA